MEINKIYNEDNMKTMGRMEDNSIDIIMTSPPYNSIDNKGRHGSKTDMYSKRYDGYQDYRDIEEYLSWSVGLFNEFDRILKDNSVVLYNFSYGTENPQLPYLLINSIIENTPFTVADTIIWKKKSALPNNVSPNRLTRICEFVFIMVRKDEIKTFKMNKKVKSVSRTGQNYFHNYFNFVEAKNNDGSQNLNKAVYSTDLCNQLLGLYSKEGWTVYDPFMGIGTTAKSCMELNMNYIGSELSPGQVEYFLDKNN